MPKKNTTNPRKTAKQARAHDTIEVILKATAHIVEGEGYQGLNTNRVAEIAGVSIGSLYQYFPGKDAIVSMLIERHIKKKIAQIETRLATWVDLPLEEAVGQLIDLVIQSRLKDLGIEKVIMEQSSRVDALSKVSQFDRPLLLSIEGYLEKLSGQIREVDLALASFLILQSVRACTVFAALDRPADLKKREFRNELVELVTRYLKMV